jgi:hypothetical protein
MNESVLPWYRFFWPWFIITLLSAAVLGSVVSAYLAVTTPDVVLEHSDQAG